MQQLLERISQHKKLFLLLDYDGTIVPIAPTPDQAHPTPGVFQMLRVLCSADAVQLAIISGRPLTDLHRLLPINGLFLAGTHGAEIHTPTGERFWLVDPNAIGATVNHLAEQLKTALAGLYGCTVENKTLSLALHYRLASESTARDATARFTRLGEPHVRGGTFEWLRGKKIIELRPAGVNKGRAVQTLLDRYSCPGRLPVYLGDDLTDEDAFRVLKDSGVTILVSAEDRQSLAQCRLKSSTEVGHLLKALARKYG